MTTHILSTIPAVGWFVVCRSEGELYRLPLVCWTLSRDEDDDAEYMDAQYNNAGIIESTNELDDFVDYWHESQGDDALSRIEEVCKQRDAESK